MKFKIWAFVHFTVPQTLNAFLYLYNDRANTPMYFGEILVSLKLLIVLIIKQHLFHFFPPEEGVFCGGTARAHKHSEMRNPAIKT